MLTGASPSSRLETALASAIADRPADVLLLSGGVDSSTLLAQAVALGAAPHRAITVSLDTKPDEHCPIHGPGLAVPCNSDHQSARVVTERLDVQWHPIRLNEKDAVDALLELCLALHSFDLGNLNNIALYVGTIHAARIGAERVWTGDDADSLFGGYRYHSNVLHWQAYLARRIPAIRPPFTGIAGILGVSAVYPWLHPSLLEVAQALRREHVLQEIPVGDRPAPPSFMDQFVPDAIHADTRLWGKIPVRQLAARHLPDDIAWRPKIDLEFGSGMCALEAPLAASVTQEDRNRLDATGIRFFNDAHRGLFLRYEETGGRIAPPKAGQYPCIGCGGGVDSGHRHCSTCGAWPADS